jgi:transcriptional regulator with XRE-family HTH domain
MFSDNITTKLQSLGTRLKEARLERNESQKRFTARLGVSIPTLRKMEKGDPTVAVGTWAQALWLLDRVEDLDKILAHTSLFAEWNNRQPPQNRQRAGKRKNR